MTILLKIIGVCWAYIKYCDTLIGLQIFTSNNEKTLARTLATCKFFLKKVAFQDKFARESGVSGEF